MHKSKKIKQENKQVRKMSISSEAKELAEIFISQRNELENEQVVYLPIDTIDGVSVGCKLEPYRENKGILFKASLSFRYDDDGDGISACVLSKYNEDGLTNEDIEIFCERVITTLPLLKLNINGNLEWETLRDKNKVKLDTLFRNLKIDNIKTTCTEECCVCYNRTKTKTDCKHSLCYRCWSKMYDDSEEGEVQCPLCREIV
jgi:hypothetical protein